MLQKKGTQPCSMKHNLAHHAISLQAEREQLSNLEAAMLTCNAHVQVLPVDAVVASPVRSEAASTREGGPADQHRVRSGYAHVLLDRTPTKGCRL